MAHSLNPLDRKQVGTFSRIKTIVDGAVLGQVDTQIKLIALGFKTQYNNFSLRLSNA